MLKNTKLDKSLEILAENRKKLHQRRTLSNVDNYMISRVHHKTFSTHLPDFTKDLGFEIDKISQEIEARKIQQKHRDLMFDSMLDKDQTLTIEDLNAQSKIEDPPRKTSNLLDFCKSWFTRCIKF